jgi:hypothetical protein
MSGVSTGYFELWRRMLSSNTLLTHRSVPFLLGWWVSLFIAPLHCCDTSTLAEFHRSNVPVIMDGTARQLRSGKCDSFTWLISTAARSVTIVPSMNSLWYKTRYTWYGPHADFDDRVRVLAAAIAVVPQGYCWRSCVAHDVGEVLLALYSNCRCPPERYVY